MKKAIYIFILFISQYFFGQQSNQLWKGYFSYNEIVDVESTPDAVFAATQNAVFSKITTSNDLKIFNSINGLKPESITTIHHSQSTNKTFAGNTNGLLLIVNSDGSVSTKVDIINEVPVPPNKKKINDFYEHEGKLYIATDYGISVMDVTTSEFIITYFIGTAGEETEVLQTTVLNNEIYAVTRNFGIRKGNLTNPNLYDFSQWQTFDSGYWGGIVTFNNELVAMNSDSRTYRYNGTTFQQVLNQTQAGLKIKTNGTELIVTTQNHVFVLNQSYIVLADITQIPDFNAIFEAATVVNGIIYIGTEKDGLFSTPLANPTTFIAMSPNGPVRNYIFRVKKAPNYLWAVYGGYTKQYNPYTFCCGGPSELPISYYSIEENWNHIPYSDLLETKAISSICINPNNQNEVFFGSFFSGLLKVNDLTPEILYNASNSGNVESFPGVVLVNGPAFDKNNNIWLTNSRFDIPLKVFKSSGTWQSYGFNNTTTNPPSDSYNEIKIDKNNTKWIPSYRNGVVIFNENYNNKVIVVNSETGNLPDNDVRTIAIDNNDRVWIGTAAGLRTISNISQFLSSDELTSSSIIIQEGDLAQELFYQQTILDIEVDGANRKWVSILDGGVFLISADGQKTIYNFTKDNSPLPSNNVNDIEIDGVTGEVLFATEKGMVSYLGISTKPSDNLSNVYVYPNPVRPEFLGTVKISGLTDKANLKITDIEGNLVFEATTSGGTLEWDTTAFGKYKVATGVYMVFVSSKDGLDTTVKKIMIIR